MRSVSCTAPLQVTIPQQEIELESVTMIRARKYEHLFYIDYQHLMKIKDIPQFEYAFKDSRFNIPRNTFAIENPMDLNSIYPLHLSDNKYPEEMNDLLFLQNETISHHCLINDLPKLLGKTHHWNFLCRNCLQSFSTQQSLTNLKQMCGKYNKYVVKLSNREIDILYFENDCFCSRLSVVTMLTQRHVRRSLMIWISFSSKNEYLLHFISSQTIQVSLTLVTRVIQVKIVKWYLLTPLTWYTL